MRRRGFIWVLGGLALGLGIALLIGVLLFWAWPAYRQAKSPLGSVASGPIVLRYLKESPVAARAQELAPRLGEEWQRIVELLDIPQEVLPQRIYVYLYAEAGELPAAFSARSEEEATPIAVVDLPVDRPVAGTFCRLACSLAYGRPGNLVLPRGLVLYLDAPNVLWAAEAAISGYWQSWELLFRLPDRLLPQDPWEELFFQVDAPWAGAAPTLESLRWLLAAGSEQPQGGWGWEAVAAAFAGFVLERYGGAGVRAFWLASGWEGGARALGVPPEDFAAHWEGQVAGALAEARSNPIIQAKAALYSGRPSQALALLSGVQGPEAAGLRAQAYIALGRPEQALAFLPEAAGLEGLSSLEAGRLLLLAEGAGWEEELTRAEGALSRAAAFWGLPGEALPERVTIYVTKAPPPVEPPWGVIWTSPEKARLSEAVVRLVHSSVSPLGMPQFDTLTEGLTLVLAYPERDFRREAARVEDQGRWVPISQSLFDTYPRHLAEAEAGALAAFLLERFGAEAVHGLWQALLEGLSPYSAASQVLGVDLEELDEALVAWASGA
ncbi:hypothetical protein H5T52_05235 [Candidatus Bipolaricaulota bacterium]|nr:hypothetical protein [Candidatus Bipolaricaulota bacterium]